MLTLAVKEALEMGFILRRAAIFTMVAGLTVSALAHFREQSPAARGVGSAGKARLPAAGSARAAGEGDAAARAERYLNSVRDEPGLLVGFLARMPKGGDLHNHLSGAVYAESYIDYAAADGDCVDLGVRP